MSKKTLKNKKLPKVKIKEVIPILPKKKKGKKKVD